MFLATAFAYPLVLAVLCLGAGLLADRLSGRVLPAVLLPAVGAAALIAVTQLETYVAFAAPATPYVIALVAVAGIALERVRAMSLLRLRPGRLWWLSVPLLVYVVALAPVILAGRPSFSSYLVLGDSAVHMLGADFLLRHGQDYSHLNLSTSNGAYVHYYYGSSYPSGSDTLFGASARLLQLPLIWAFQPFNAFMVALAACPAWALLRRVRMPRPLAAIATIAVCLPALVYAYVLIGSIKEISSLPMILTLGVLVVRHEDWLQRSARAGIPFALVLAAGVSSLGIGFGAWGVGEAVVLGPLLIRGLLANSSARRAGALVATGVFVTALAALPTWANVSGSLSVARSISATSNPGNLSSPLYVIQIFGAWLRGSYKALPVGASLSPTYILIGVTAGAALLGIFWVVWTGQRVLAAWVAAMLLVWLVVSQDSTTWVSAKTLMLSSPIVMLLAWSGVAALANGRLRWVLRPLAALLALVIFGGVAASDALQYHESDLAPTARFDELAQIDSRFAGRGPALFTDFDEYSLYLLSDIGVAGPDFIYPPAALAGYARYRYPVELDRLPPGLLLGYPLIITRLDPAEERPPSAYRLLWRGSYYEVWGRRPGAPPALADEPLSGTLSEQCTRIHGLAGLAAAQGAHLVAAAAPKLLEADIDHSIRPLAWGRMHQGVQLVGAGTLSVPVTLPRSGVWQVWLQGQIMPTLHVAINGHPIGALSAQLGGNSVVPNTLTPLTISIARGTYTFSISRAGVDLSPGNGGSAALFHVLLTQNASAQQALHVVAPARWHALCGRQLEWIEAIPN